MNWRYRFTLFLLIFSFFLVIARLFYWQIVKAEELFSLGQSQYGGLIKILPQRGEIKTSDGFSIAANKLTYLVFANPKEIKDKVKTISILSSNLEIDTATVSAALSLDRFWVPIKSKVDQATKDRLDALNLRGVGFQQESTRFYPEASMAAHLIGFVGGDNKGYFGVEGYYDRQLKGKVGIAVQTKDVFGRPILTRANEKSKEVNGRNLILNIDRAIQFILENRLKEGIERYEAFGGMAALMDPRTGRILAMVSFPSFDPGSFQEYPQDYYKNPFVSNMFEPGSTFKPLIMASALDSKTVKPDTKCPICAGPITIGDYQIRTWNNKYNKDTNMIEVIKNSDNTGMVFVGKSLGLSKMLSYLKKFGIGELTGIDLQGEVPPNLKSEELWYPIDLATASFGQGISVTPIELLAAFSSIANNGMRMEPHVVGKIETTEGETIAIKPKVLDKPISQQTAKVMTEMLVYAVEKGEAKWAKPKGYRIAGKTGTAQIPVAGHYDPNKTITSFIGFAPANDPKFSMLVVVDRPTTSIYGSETAAPIFFEIAKDLLTYYNIPPTE
ncbi:MAG: penicillin-binding protein 2 [Candidatus Levybacteria bacterium]|nr:penicillin-binding protein 2 [Candidatus Levybacteria bacterium]MBI3093085.1 penicillin-binding protein 2 [Candidatus Levybacteria bacterium]